MEAARLRLEPAVPQVSDAHTGWALIAGRDAVFCLWRHLDCATHRARAQGNADKRSEEEMLPLAGMHQRMSRRYYSSAADRPEGTTARGVARYCGTPSAHAHGGRRNGGAATARWGVDARRGMCYGAIGL